MFTRISFLCNVSISVFVSSSLPKFNIEDPFPIVTKMAVGRDSSEASRNFSVGFFIGILLGFCTHANGLNLWPMPKSVSTGLETLYLSRDFQLTTEGSKYSDGAGILKDAFQRMIALVESSHSIDGRLPGSGVLAGVNVVVLSSDDKVIAFHGSESIWL